MFSQETEYFRKYTQNFSDASIYGLKDTPTDPPSRRWRCWSRQDSPQEVHGTRVRLTAESAQTKATDSSGIFPSFSILFSLLLSLVQEQIQHLCLLSLSLSACSVQGVTENRDVRDVRGHLLTLASSLIFHIMSSMQAAASSLESWPSTRMKTMR